MGWALRKMSKGFTIVELLIVIVVIAILAAITIVAYNGVTRRANDAAAQTALATAQKKIATYFIDNADTYPTTLSDAGLSTTSGPKYQYTANNTTDPKGYCITASSNGSSFYIANQFTYLGSASDTINQPAATSGACPGHSPTGTAITNLVINSSAGVSTSGYTGPNSTSFVRTSAKAYSGTNSVVLTMPQSAGTTVGLGYYLLTDFTTALKPNTTYVTSAWVWVPTGTVDVKISVQGTGKVSTAGYTQRETSVKDQWVRIYESFTTGTSGNVYLYVLNSTATPTAGTQFWADAFMLTEGAQPVTFANGNNAGWAWSGASGLSVSSGPEL